MCADGCARSLEYLVERTITNSGNEFIAERSPLVTFALFSYNQQKYIRDAVEGALTQDYQPLEIILSDDSSTDRTYEIMQELAAAYKGIHRIIVRQTKRNVGVFAHVVEVASIASGKLLVLAAGDDVSKKHRVSEIVRIWNIDSPWGIHSRYDICNSSGEIIAKNQRSEDLFDQKCELRRYFIDIDPKMQIIHGATSAYDIRAFSLLPKAFPEHIMSEDGVLSIFLGAFGKRCVFIDQSLIFYRQHDDAITMTVRPDSFISLKKARLLTEKESAYSYNMYKRAKMFLENLNGAPDQVRPINMAVLLREIVFQRVKSRRVTWQFREGFQAIIIAFQEKRIGSIIPALIGTKAGALYVFFSFNIRHAIRKLTFLVTRTRRQ